MTSLWQERPRVSCVSVLPFCLQCHTEPCLTVTDHRRQHKEQTFLVSYWHASLDTAIANDQKLSRSIYNRAVRWIAENNHFVVGDFSEHVNSNYLSVSLSQVCLLTFLTIHQDRFSSWSFRTGAINTELACQQIDRGVKSCFSCQHKIVFKSFYSKINVQILESQ